MSRKCGQLVLKRCLHGSVLARPCAPAGTHYQTIADVREKMKRLVEFQSTFGSQAPDRSQLASYLASSQSELPPRRLYDSYDEAVIPLGADLMVREEYHNAFKRVRFGRLLEDLDTFAVWLVYKHSLLPKNPDPTMSPMGIVTGMVDRIDVENRKVPPDRDIRMRGLVTYVGTSSAETLVVVEQGCKRLKAVVAITDPHRDGQQWDPLLEARFVLVARDPKANAKAYLNPLVPEGPEEMALLTSSKQVSEVVVGYPDNAYHSQELLLLCEICSQKPENADHRKQWSEESLFKLPPNQEESRLIHEEFLKTVYANQSVFSVRLKPNNTVWMEEAVLKNVHICHPQNRNIHGKIFGGFLMRNAFELAWSNAWLYSGTRPIILSVDDIKFRRPVEIGSLLLMSARLVYTDGPDMQMRVHAEIIDPATQTRETTNTFYFTFRASKDTPVRHVAPKTYADAMLYLTGRRHYEASKHYREKLEGNPNVRINP